MRPLAHILLVWIVLLTGVPRAAAGEWLLEPIELRQLLVEMERESSADQRAFTLAHGEGGIGGTGITAARGEGGIGGTGITPPRGEGGIGGTGITPARGEEGIGGTGITASRGEEGIGGTGITASRGEGGIGGTGIVGEITGFGSIIVNGVHIDYEPEMELYNSQQTPLRADQLKIGQVVAVEADATAERYRARRITVKHPLVGPITAIDRQARTIEVMGQRVVLDGERFDADQFLRSARTGERIAVSGFWEGETIHSTRIDPALGGVNSVTGPLSLQREQPYIGQIPLHFGSHREGAIVVGEERTVYGTLDAQQQMLRVEEDSPAVGRFGAEVRHLLIEGYPAIGVDGAHLQQLKMDVGEVVPGERQRIRGTLVEPTLLRGEVLPTGHENSLLPMGEPKLEGPEFGTPELDDPQTRWDDAVPDREIDEPMGGAANLDGDEAVMQQRALLSRGGDGVNEMSVSLPGGWEGGEVVFGAGDEPPAEAGAAGGDGGARGRGGSGGMEVPAEEGAVGGVEVPVEEAIPPAESVESTESGDESGALSASVPSIGSMLELYATIPAMTLRDLHYRPLALDASQQCAWRSESLNSQIIDTRIHAIEAGFCGDFAGHSRLGLGLGKSRVEQRYSGSAVEAAGRYLIAEWGYRFGHSPLLLSTTALSGSWEAKISRSYTTQDGSVQTSYGAPEIEATVVRGRADWVDLLAVEGLSVTPKAEYSLAFARVGGYSEQGGEEPAQFNPYTISYAETRWGVTLRGRLPELTTEWTLEQIRQLDRKPFTISGTVGTASNEFTFSRAGGEQQRLQLSGSVTAELSRSRRVSATLLLENSEGNTDAAAGVKLEIAF